MESVTPCQVSINKNDVFLHGESNSMMDKLQDNGSVTTVGINVTLAPMESMQTVEVGNGVIKETEPPDLPEKENSFAITNSNNLVSGAMTSEQLANLKQCRNRAYSIVNKKKRMHLNASLPQHLQKEWLALYPDSSLTGKRLLEIFETHSISSVINDLPKKSNRGRKRKVNPSEAVSQPLPSPTKKTKSSPSEFEVNNGVIEVISEASHEDRQWTTAMLCNLMFCNKQAEIKKTTLETEWQLLYPNSLLSARNLKSRFTVYQRTHSEKSTPKKPTKEKIILKIKPLLSKPPAPVVPILQPLIPTQAPTAEPRIPPIKLSKSPIKLSKPESESPATPEHESPEPAVFAEAGTEIDWSEEMVSDMFDTLDAAREELNSTDNNIVSTRWHQLWLEKNPTSSNVRADDLYNRYTDHVKKASQLLSPVKSSKSPAITSEESLPQMPDEVVEAEEALEAEVEPEPVKPPSLGFQWTQDLFEELQREQQYVEDKLRCIQDDYFFELLQERWSDNHPDCRDGPEELRNVLHTFMATRLKGEVVVAEDLDNNVKQELFDEYLETEGNNGDTKETIKSEIDPDDVVKTELTPYECKEEPVETVELPRSKWVCDNHYIHVFYDDQDKNNECILTDQILQMRNTLVPMFPGQDLFKSGKKPPGFAKMLLSEWLRHYPDSQENTKTISMKIGRYDRAPLMLMQDTKSANGRINWSPAMIETIRVTRERAVVRFSSEGAGMAGSMSRYWREEWEMAYPELNIDWKQVVSRYHYHFGAERRDSTDGPETVTPSITTSRSMRGSHERSGEGEVEEAGAREDIRGFRQWTAAMTEDLVIMRNILLREDPDADPSSKAFAKQLMALFKDKHPNCMESERSLLSKLRESNHLTTTKEAVVVKSRPKAVKVETPKKNPAVDLMSDIEGFTDWNLGMVRDFISCMDRARRKYTEMKEVDPQMKLVPLLLVEWKAMYPGTGETVRSFLVRIRSLKTNKELIKAKLGEHDLLPRMSNDETPSQSTNESMKVDETEEEMTQEEAIRRFGKFVWDSNNMMPVVISTRAKAIAKQKKEMTQGKRISYAKIWIKEFKKVYPNCPYTANNLSVHYWYWTSRQENNGNDKSLMPKKAAVKEAEIEEEVEDDLVEEAPQWSEWSEEDLEDLKRIAEKVDRMLKADGAERQLKFPKLLHSVWLNLHPESVETEESLLTIYKTFISQQRSEAEVKVDSSIKARASGTLLRDIWTPRHNKMLRAIVESLKVSDSYTRSNMVKEWCRHFPRVSWDILSSRIDDCGYPQPTHFVLVKDKTSEAPKKTSKTSRKKSAPEADPSPAGLNARGQMRWTQQAVTDLLECHKLGLKSKNSKPDKKLADLVHQKFKQRHPYCPIAPNVLLTKCYILRSELKSGKLVLNDEHEDTGEKYRGESGLRTWTRQMLDELVASRKRAIGRKRSVGGGVNFGKLLGDLWLEEFRSVFPDYKSSKKNLFRKYKWWRQRRAETEKDESKMMPKVDLDAEGVLFSELKKSLCENSVTLPPFVSSKVIMLAQHWVENTPTREEAREPEPDTEMETEGPSEGMITLPGGAVLVAKLGAGDQARQERGAEPPDVSITLSGVQSSDDGVSITLCNNTNPSTVVTPVPAPEAPPAAPGLPPELLSILDSMELPLALLPTLLAVYRDVRDTHKILCVQGYCVSWSTLLTARLRSAWPGTSLTTQSMDSLVTQTLTAAGHAQITCKTVHRSGPVIPAAKISPELLTRIQDHVDSFDRHPLASWKTWQRDDEVPLSSRQFVSLAQFLCPSSDTYNWDDLMWQADLCEVWSGLSSTVDNNNSNNKKTRRQYRRVSSKREDDNVSFNKIGRWLKRIKNIGTPNKLHKKRPRLVTNNLRLFWSNEKIEILKHSKLVALDKWRFAQHRKYSSLKSLIVKEFKKRITLEPSNLSSGQILGKLSQVQRGCISRLARVESREWNRYVNEYNEFLENEADIETEEYVDEVEENVVKRELLEGEVDYNIDANVIDYIRAKEGGKKSSAPVWGSYSLSFLLKARTLALASRDKWEKWAVAKYGSLQVAVSNPRVKVPKVEELLMEEWSQLRPNMSGISAYTLNSYLKKFDGVKRTLIEDQEEARRLRELRAAPPVRISCHPNTDIPIYKLSQLETFPKLPENVKQLIGSRQRALTSHPDSSLRYLHLWSEQWLQETGEKTEGWVLQQRLHKLQSSSSVRNKLRRFVEILEGEEAERKVDIDPLSFEFEDPVVAPRDSMFPRVPDPISDMLIRRKHEEVDILAYDEENIVEVLGEGRLGLPVMISINDILEEEGLVFKPKMSYMEHEDINQDEVIRTKVRDSCEPRGYQHFNNVNNFTSYLELSRLPEQEREDVPTFGQKMASSWLCQSVISDCLSLALSKSEN